MKKLLLLGALLVVGATSFSFEKVLTNGGAGSTYEGSAALKLRTQGSVITATDTPVLVVEAKTSGSGTDTLEFDFSNLVAGGAQKTVEGEFETRIEVNGTPQVIPADTLSAVLNDGTNTNATTISLKLTDTQNPTTELGDLTYKMAFSPVGTNPDNVKAYNGTIVAAVTPSSEQGTFLNMDGSVEISVKDFTYPNP